MTLATLVLLLVSLQRAGELVLARRNTQALLRRGAYEVGAAHYPAVVLLHAAWLASLWLFGWQQPVDPALLALFVVLQGLRVWVIATLGSRWTTRIIVLPGAGVIRTGPYRFLRHPNYAIVIAEVAILPLALGLWPLAALFSVANAALLWYRIRLENQVLERIS